MKALSLIQPWASLVVMGAKKYETRSWNTFYRGRILIHASKKKDPYAVNLCIIEPWNKHINGIIGFYALPFGAVIGEVVIKETESTEIVSQNLFMRGDTDELAFGNYNENRMAWKLINPIKYKNIIPCKGHLNLWPFPDELLKQSIITQ